MPKKPTNSRKPWSAKDVSQLERLAGGNTPTRVIGTKLRRSPDAIYSKASDAGISLKPTNQSPYGTRSKGR